MDKLKIYSVSDEYISFLRNDEKLKSVFDNKTESRIHTRKYLGIVFEYNTFKYFVPFSSPKKSDYIVAKDGTKTIRKSIIPIIRMTTNDTITGTVELKGTLKLSNMIPVPESALTPYDISQEPDTNYRQIVQKEWDFIRVNTSLIFKNARVIYNQKTKCVALYKDKKVPGYLNDTIDFQYAEQKCMEFQENKLLKI